MSRRWHVLTTAAEDAPAGRLYTGHYMRFLPGKQCPVSEQRFWRVAHLAEANLGKILLARGVANLVGPTLA